VLPVAAGGVNQIAGHSSCSASSTLGQLPRSDAFQLAVTRRVMGAFACITNSTTIRQADKTAASPVESPAGVLLN